MAGVTGAHVLAKTLMRSNLGALPLSYSGLLSEAGFEPATVPRMAAK